MSDKPQTLPPQEQQRQPGLQTEMTPPPSSGESRYLAAGKLKGKCAIITGGDSGIGRAVALAFAKEGADILISYYDEHEDAQETRRLVEAEGRKCILLAGDIADESHCEDIVKQALAERGIRVNGVAAGPIWTPLIPALHRTAHTVATGRRRCSAGGNLICARYLETVRRATCTPSCASRCASMTSERGSFGSSVSIIS